MKLIVTFFFKVEHTDQEESFHRKREETSKSFQGIQKSKAERWR